MKLDDLINQNSEWLKGKGPSSDIIISSRIRLARNIGDYAFVDWADEKTKKRIVQITKEAILTSNYMKGCLYVEMSNVSPIDRQFLIERHLIGKEHALNPKYKTVFIGDKEIVSIMVNEEDHMRLQVIQSGFSLESAWDIMKSLENDLEKRIGFSFSDEFGYLTACPTNTGTGMRASVMIHLPGVVMTRQIDSLINGISKLGLTVRGFFGEGTEALGNFFQISNQVTLGQIEDDIIDNLKRLITQVVAQEKASREFLRIKKKDIIEDKISRAYATLEGAHIMTSTETIELLSMVRLGIDLNLIDKINYDKLNELLILMQPAHLQKIEGKVISAAERDIKRTELIKKKLGIK
ncbi:MAG: protein arginine kinase [Candidatus Omnitrophota bacterium]